MMMMMMMMVKIILPVKLCCLIIVIVLLVLYECETWSLTVKEEHVQRVFENEVLRMIYGRRREEITGRWRKLHNEEMRLVS